ncbi:MAG: PAS domain S-box protein, partial [Thermocrispum sp.]
MSEAVSPEVIDSVRRWALGLRDADTGSVDFDDQIQRIAREVQAARDESSRSADHRFAAFYRYCPTGALLTGADGVIAAVNPAFLRLVGTGKDAEYVGAEVVDLGATEHDKVRLRAVLAAVGTATKAHLATLEVRSAGEDARLVQVTASALSGDETGPLILMFQDVHEVRELQVTLWHQGLHDPLTGLPNDAHLRSKLETMLAGENDQ